MGNAWGSDVGPRKYALCAAGSVPEGLRSAQGTGTLRRVFTAVSGQRGFSKTRSYPLRTTSRDYGAESRDQIIELPRGMSAIKARAGSPPEHRDLRFANQPSFTEEPIRCLAGYTQREKTKMKLKFGLLALATFGGAALSTGTASAMPVTPL